MILAREENGGRWLQRLALEVGPLGERIFEAHGHVHVAVAQLLGHPLEAGPGDVEAQLRVARQQGRQRLDHLPLERCRTDADPQDAGEGVIPARSLAQQFLGVLQKPCGPVDEGAALVGEQRAARRAMEDQ